MESHTPAFKFRLGLFIITGIALFILGIFIIGKQKNLFDPVITLKANFFNVSGLQVGNAVRFSGINIGTVDKILIVNDSTVKVEMVIKKEVQQFLKGDSQAGIGSEGIIGDKVVVLSQGTSEAKSVRDGQLLPSSEPVETDAIMKSLQITADNAALATDGIAEMINNINAGQGTLGRLIKDKSMAANLDQTLVNLKSSTKGLNENMEAVKHNFLLKGYFKKKEKKAEKARKEAEEKAALEKKDAAEAAAKAKQKK